MTNGQHERAVGFLQDLVKVRLYGGFLQLEVSGQVAAHFLQLGAKEAQEADAQLDQLQVPVDHKVPREGLAKSGRADVLAESGRLRLEGSQRVALQFGQLRPEAMACRRAVVGRSGRTDGVLEADERTRLAHRQQVLDDLFDDGQRETEMVAQRRLGFQLVDGDPNGDAHPEQVRGDALLHHRHVVDVVDEKTKGKKTREKEEEEQAPN